MTNEKRVEQIRLITKNDTVAVEMLMASCIDRANGEEAWLTSKGMIKAAELIVLYYKTKYTSLQGEQNDR